MTDVAFKSAKQLAGLIRRRKIGCLELLDHYLDRVERYNPALNAIVATDIPAARKRAKEADRALGRGKVWGPLHGVPMTVKESYDIVGLPTTWGVPAYEDSFPRRNALAIDRWLNSGAVIFGKTNVPPYLADGQSTNDIYGTTNNPWDHSRVPGGSSGGSAAAVAAGLSGLESGSDIASSIRNPAHHCGVFGHKPTYGICPPRGHSLGPSVAPADISVIGPLARSADDLDIALSVLAGPDEIDSQGYRLALPPPKKKALKDFKVAVMLDDPNAEVDREVQGLIQKLADFLGKKKAKISMTARPEIDMTRAHRLFGVLLNAATSGRQTDEAFAQKLKAAEAIAADDWSANARRLKGNVLRHRDWLVLNEERHKLRWKWHQFFQDYDLLLCPAFSTAAIQHTDIPSDSREIVINNRKWGYNEQLFWAGYTGMAYLPGTVAPIGFTSERLPVGVQIVGPQYGDRTCIHFARLLETEYQPFVPPPGYEA